ncbi:ABC transporter substrate-binding protein [Chelatococcus reniformis]|uniref:Branched-chain amino acid ABC transporter substrate-binding protein n=1 Tax=Chelatococcus reniformis TaxID=1494448 RepID=A0A916USR7_9HYPH|nr:ABC transporter substrate-binding protein [Chelatococcus reniformis]GGC83220.1 branched-chain amino acid ABC transporter substrate-binding protein [Chelatococcus reniformis]
MPFSAAFDLRGDGSIDRRSLLRTAARLGAAAAGASLASPLFGGDARAAGEAVKIGWVRPTTGRLVTSFAPLYLGGGIAVDEINQAGGILGRPISKFEEDDEASPAKEPAIVRKLHEAEVNFAVGPTGSSQSLASLAATTRAKIIQSTYAAAAEAGDGKRYPYHYQLMYNTDQQGQVCANYMVKNLGIKKVGILQESTAFGEQATTSTKAALKALGIDPVSVQVYPITAPDLSAYVRNLQKEGAEGVIAWIANVPNAAMIFNTMKTLKWFPPVTGHSGLFLPALFELVPPDAIKNVFATYYRNFTWTDQQKPGERQVALAKKLLAIPEAKGYEVNVASSPYYDFVYLLKAAVEQAKSFEVDKVKQALDSTRNFPGLVGNLSFTPDNHCGIDIKDVVLASVASGQDPQAMGSFRERAPGQ